MKLSLLLSQHEWSFDRSQRLHCATCKGRKGKHKKDCEYHHIIKLLNAGLVYDREV